MNRPIRVCFVIENLLPAGTELWIVNLIQNIDRTKVEPYLCLLDGFTNDSIRLEPDCEILKLGVRKLTSVQGLRAAFRFRRWLREKEIDVVQVHHADPTYFAVPLARLSGVPKIVQTKYDIGYWLTGLDIWLHRIYRKMIHATVANCVACKNASIQQEWSRPDSVFVVNNGIPMEDLQSVPELSKTEGQQIGMVSNLRPVKNPDIFLEAAQLVHQTHQNATFHLAGNGPLLARLQRQIYERNLVDCVFLHGNIDNIPDFLALLQITVLCSSSEGLSHALLEYMAAGRAVIATAVGGNTELIEHERNGLLVPVGNPRQLADSIRRLLDDKWLRQRLGQFARATVAERFSFESMTHRFEEFYRQLVRNNNSRHGSLTAETSA